jgi:hypothetical protein
MKRKTIVAILSVALLSSFFFPVFDWYHFEMSGLNYVLSTHISSYKYLLLLVPFSALFLFWNALSNEIDFFNSKILSWLPLVSLLFISIMRYKNWSSEITFSGNENAFSTIDIGFWMILFFSVLLILVHRKSKPLYQYEKHSDFFE